MKCPKCKVAELHYEDFKGGSGGILGMFIMCHNCGYSKFNSAWEDLNES